MLLADGETRKAESALRESLELAERLAAQFNAHGTDLELGTVCYRLGSVLYHTGRIAEAEDFFRKGIDRVSRHETVLETEASGP